MIEDVSVKLDHEHYNNDQGAWRCMIGGDISVAANT
jgi:hypothetical protein